VPYAVFLWFRRVKDKKHRRFVAESDETSGHSSSSRNDVTVKLRANWWEGTKD
jgi:hypothetical protein